MHVSRRSIAFLTCALAVLVSSAVWATEIFQLEEAALTSADRATLQSQACKPFHVLAERVSGWRLKGYPDSKPGARVDCAPHLITATYSVHRVVQCLKGRQKWRCDTGGLLVQARVFEQGPYEIDIQDLQPEEAVNALRCLEAGLRQRPDLVGAELIAKPGMLISRNYGNDRAPGISATVSTPAKECLAVTFARACDPTSPVPLEVESESCSGE
jgi:hypothetical protein